MYTFLAESQRFKIYSECESVYLECKHDSGLLRELNLDGNFVGAVYGDPNGGLISGDEAYAVITGAGILIQPLRADIDISAVHLYESEEGHMRTFGPFQDIISDKSWSWFRFVSWHQDQPRVFRLHAVTHKLEML